MDHSIGMQQTRLNSHSLSNVEWENTKNTFKCTLFGGMLSYPLFFMRNWGGGAARNIY